MPPPVESRTAVVTGSTSGIGYAIARRLLAEGYRVTLHGRDDLRLTTALEKLAADGCDTSQVTGYIADLSDRGATERFAEHLSSMRVDVLVNNAGEIDARPYSLLTAPLDEFEKRMRVSSWAGLLLARAVLPGMVERDDHGRILWTVGSGALDGVPGGGPGGLAQFLLLALSQQIEREVTAGSTVTSNVIIVGPTKTEGAVEAVAQAMPGVTFEQTVTRIWPDLPAGRPAQASDVAEAYVRLAHRGSVTTRGAVIRADGGATRRFG